ncbi:gamma-glutamyl-gamma-aminobutyrate hydrolase family protein [Roseibium album]|uniref:gamma-glutamyl-gamma-aminobutyrate hydrolase family protein n=1 Tax=Roseibium album TaxID=311410 RepID=UPI0024923044|nr:gamma-glutamyl-gamma-aminobutyrate hydrolase family protein [Roseibium album]
MKKVVVSQRVDHVPGRNETRDALDQRLAALLSVVGCVPIPVPNCLSKVSVAGNADSSDLESWMSLVEPQGVVLSGGNNIGFCEERDSTERFLLDFAMRKQLPAIGICRGMQMMGHWAGTSLRHVEEHVRTRHKISGEIKGIVNSYHDYSLADCPKGFRVLARSDDDEIEAIGHQFLSWEGWMWHPERDEQFAEQDVNRLRQLLVSQKNNRK